MQSVVEINQGVKMIWGRKTVGSFALFLIKMGTIFGHIPK